MLDRKFIKTKLELISRDLKHLEEFRNFTIHQMAQDFIRYSALKNILMEIIGRGIDINQHIVVEKADLKKSAPLEYRETFLYLAKINILPEDFAKTISASVGFRNAIVHHYNNIDQDIIYQSVGQAIDQYAQYCDYILKFLEES